MKELEIVNLLARVFAGNENAETLVSYMNDECKYDSDYAKKHIRTAEKIIESLNAVAEAVRNSEEDCSYNCEVVELASIFNEGVTIDDLHGDSFWDAYEYGILMYQYHSDNPAAVIYVKFNPGGQIAEIELSRNKKWFNIAFYGDLQDSEKDIPYTVKPMTQHDRQVKEMREAWVGQRHEYEELDDSEVYIWRQADAYFKNWLEKQRYQIIESEVFEDSIGYHCLKDNVLYTIYMYAFGNTEKMHINGDYCAKLQNQEFSHNFILVTCLKVERVLSGGKYKYYVGFRNDAGNTEIQLWHPHNIMGKDVLLYFPRKEMYDLFDKFMYAFNNESVDAFECIVTAHNPSFEEHDNGGCFMNDGFFTCLHHIYNEYGKMKCGYLSLDGFIYNQISYIDGYGWFSFSVDQNDKICNVVSHPFDDEVVDFLKAEEDVPERIFRDIPNPISIRVLPPVLTERFAILVKYDNGENLKYVLPISEADENAEVIQYERMPLTDGIWKSAELVKSHEAKYRGFPDGGAAIRLKTGFCISTMKCHEYGYPYSEPEDSDDIIYEDNKRLIQAIWSWDVNSIYKSDSGVLKVLERGNAFNYNGVSTLVTKEGKRVTSLDFVYLSDAGEGLMEVGVAGKGYGYINSDGKFVIPPQYDSTDDFEDGFAKVRKGDKWYLIDKNGKETEMKSNLENRYEAVGRFSEGLCAVSKLKLSFMDLAYHSDDADFAGIWGFVNEAGEEIIKPQYIYAYPFDKGVALVCKGEWTRDPKWNNKYNKGKYWTEEELWGGINASGETVIPFIFDEIKDMWTSEDEPPVYMVHYGGWENGHWGVIDASGNWLAEPVFEDIDYEFTNGMFAFYSEDKWSDPPMGIYDTKQKRVIFEPQFNDVEFMDDGYLKVELFDEQLGHVIEKIIDLQGKEKFHSDYTSIYTSLFAPYLEVSRDVDGERKSGLLDMEGNIVVPIEYEYMSASRDLLNKKKFEFKMNGKLGICNFDGTIDIEPLYDGITLGQNDLYITTSKPDEHSHFNGLITCSGDEILPMIYRRIMWLDENLLLLETEEGCICARYVVK